MIAAVRGVHRTELGTYNPTVGQILKSDPIRSDPIRSEIFCPSPIQLEII